LAGALVPPRPTGAEAIRLERSRSASGPRPNSVRVSWSSSNTARTMQTTRRIGLIRSRMRAVSFPPGFVIQNNDGEIHLHHSRPGRFGGELQLVDEQGVPERLEPVQQGERGGNRSHSLDLNRGKLASRGTAGGFAN